MVDRFFPPETITKIIRHLKCAQCASQPQNVWNVVESFNFHAVLVQMTSLRRTINQTHLFISTVLEEMEDVNVLLEIDHLPSPCCSIKQNIRKHHNYCCTFNTKCVWEPHSTGCQSTAACWGISLWLSFQYGQFEVTWKRRQNVV